MFPKEKHFFNESFLLKFYKTGFNTEMLCWMQEEADKLQLSESSRAGGIVLDEMSIQEDLSLVAKGLKSSFGGLVHTTPMTDDLLEDRKGNIYPLPIDILLARHKESF
jgi:hypothetical protein